MTIKFCSILITADPIDHPKLRADEAHLRQRAKYMAKEKKRDSKKQKKRDKKKKKKKSEKKRKRSANDSSSGSDSGADEARQRKRLRAAETFLAKKAAEGSTRAHISPSDFFVRAKEFRVWLSQAKGRYFEELTGDEARKYFVKFVALWNTQALPAPFYDGIPQAIIESTKRTRHTWAFTTKINDADRRQLATVKDTIDIATNSTVRNRVAPRAAPRAHTIGAPRRPAAAAAGAAAVQPARCATARPAPERSGATGHERRVEKRREASSRMHASSRSRDADADGAAATAAMARGAGAEDSFAAAAGSLRRREQQRGAARAERLMTAREKEKAKMDAFMNAMGIAPGQRIVMKPRT
jgi:hypothetical protein